MSWFSRFFKKPQGSAPNLHQAAFSTPGNADTKVEMLHMGDYATFDGRSGKVPPSGTVAIMHFDFVSTFPAISWLSQKGYDADYPEGFSYKILSARHEPSGEYECAVVMDLGDRGKAILRRFMLPKEQFPTQIEELVREYEPLFEVQFERRDFSHARTAEDFQRSITGGQPPSLPPIQPPPLPEVRHPLTEEQAKAIAHELNRPILEPLQKPSPGFVSSEPFAESDLPARLQQIAWFANCGQGPTVKLSVPIRQAANWTRAQELCRSDAWDNVQIEAQNQLTMWLHQHAPQDDQRWNEFVIELRENVLKPLAVAKVQTFCQAHGLDKSVLNSVAWDILGALMENRYIYTGHQVFFFLELLKVYEAGHFPCGWAGAWPRGELYVY